jgi:multidrug resistance efflux pump
MVVALVALSCACGSRRSEPLAPRTVDLRGELVASKTALIAAAFEGTVRRVRVRPGDSVGTGDVLVELASKDLDTNLAVARAQREWAEEKKPSVAPDASAGREEAVAAAARAGAKRDRYRALFASRDITAQELEVAEGEYAAAAQALENLRAGVRGANPQLARIEIEKARAEEALAADRVQEMTLRAPHAGVVTRLDAVEGRRVPAREPLAEVSDTSALEARAPVDPDLLRVVHAGMSAEVSILALPPRVLADRIAYIVPAGSAPQGERRAVVVVNVANPDRSLQPGTPVTLRVKTP